MVLFISWGRYRYIKIESDHEKIIKTRSEAISKSTLMANLRKMKKAIVGVQTDYAPIARCLWVRAWKMVKYKTWNLLSWCRPVGGVFLIVFWLVGLKSCEHCLERCLRMLLRSGVNGDVRSCLRLCLESLWLSQSFFFELSRFMIDDWLEEALSRFRASDGLRLLLP